MKPCAVLMTRLSPDKPLLQIQSKYYKFFLIIMVLLLSECLDTSQQYRIHVTSPETNHKSLSKAGIVDSDFHWLARNQAQTRQRRTQNSNQADKSFTWLYGNVEEYRPKQQHSVTVVTNKVISNIIEPDSSKANHKTVTPPNSFQNNPNPIESGHSDINNESLKEDELLPFNVVPNIGQRDGASFPQLQMYSNEGKIKPSGADIVLVASDKVQEVSETDFRHGGLYQSYQMLQEKGVPLKEFTEALSSVGSFHDIIRIFYGPQANLYTDDDIEWTVFGRKGRQQAMYKTQSRQAVGFNVNPEQSNNNRQPVRQNRHKTRQYRHDLRILSHDTGSDSESTVLNEQGNYSIKDNMSNKSTQINISKTQNSNTQNLTTDNNNNKPSSSLSSSSSSSSSFSSSSSNSSFLQNSSSSILKTNDNIKIYACDKCKVIGVNSNKFRNSLKLTRDLHREHSSNRRELRRRKERRRKLRQSRRERNVDKTITQVVKRRRQRSERRDSNVEGGTGTGRSSHSNTKTNNFNLKELNEAFKHLTTMGTATICSQPTPTIMHTKHLVRSANFAYFPECTIIHRCSHHSGCCAHGTTCSVKSAHNVSLPFVAMRIHHGNVSLPNQSQFVEYFEFENHTECHCQPDNVCKPCPAPFIQYYDKETKTCRCTCLDENQQCKKMKRGKGHFQPDALNCLRTEVCASPMCTYGNFSSDYLIRGRCPRKDEMLNYNNDVNKSNYSNFDMTTLGTTEHYLEGGVVNGQLKSLEIPHKDSNVRNNDANLSNSSFNISNHVIIQNQSETINFDSNFEFASDAPVTNVMKLNGNGGIHLRTNQSAIKRSGGNTNKNRDIKVSHLLKNSQTKEIIKTEGNVVFRDTTATSIYLNTAAQLETTDVSNYSKHSVQDVKSYEGNKRIEATSQQPPYVKDATETDDRFSLASTEKTSFLNYSVTPENSIINSSQTSQMSEDSSGEFATNSSKRQNVILEIGHSLTNDKHLNYKNESDTVSTAAHAQKEHQQHIVAKNHTLLTKNHQLPVENHQLPVNNNSFPVNGRPHSPEETQGSGVEGIEKDEHS